MATLTTLSNKVALTKDLKIKLLKSIQAGEIDMLDYPELRKAGKETVRNFMHQLPSDELRVVASAARILRRLG